MGYVTCTITKDGRTDEYGRPLVPGTNYTGTSDYVKALWQAGYASVASASVFDGDTSTGGNYAQPYILAQSAVPIILLSSATSITATGLITGYTVLPYTPSGVVQVVIAAYSAGVYGAQGLAGGIYYATFTNATTAGTCTCQLYTDAACTTKPSGITAGAYLGGTGDITLLSVAVPGGAMGPNGVLRLWEDVTTTNSATTKTPKAKLGGNEFCSGYAGGNLTASGVARIYSDIRNRGSQARQVCNNYASFGSTSARAYYSTDTSVLTWMTITVIMASASDNFILEAYTIEILPGA